jgi:AraC family transcriptional regulator
MSSAHHSFEIGERDLTVPRPLYARTTRICGLVGITLSQATYRPRIEIPLHTHAEHGYFNLVLQGGYCEWARHSTYQMRPGMFIWHPPGSAHSNLVDDRETSLFNIRIEAAWLDQIRDHSDKLRASSIFDRGLPIRLMKSIYDEFAHNDSLSELVIEDRIIQLLSREADLVIQSDSDSAPAWLKRAREIIHCRFEERLQLDEIANEVGVHTVHLCRAFRQHFHATIGDYIRLLRLELACRQLSVPTIPLATVAQRCGFCDQSHFSRIFKRVTSMTPLQYRAIFHDFG